ncbi:beta-glucosidase BoGH3B-like [Mangifera indica]|uniref:beta-glucosidase BoGH3B-like n=1 Tax=Mangifera indica TaxID=29780 RepID=UPI001CFBB98A|nr:beta-glucosidase BoGH3B-like [Mangifera indica]
MKLFHSFLSCFLLLLFSKTSVTAEYVKYKDPKQPVAARVKDLLSRMTLEEKIGQMVQIDWTVATAQIMKDYSIGSVLSGGGSTPLPQASTEDWVNMVNDFQKGSLASRLGIPMIYGIDAVHGHNNVYNATIFPHNVGLGAARDPDLVKRIGAATAAETRATGIPYVFAPCIAVCRDPRWGRCYESYSEDHKVVQSMTEIIPGLQGDIPSGSRKGVPYVGGKDKVAACAKHFVGDGGTTNGINENNTVIDFHELLGIHMPAYSESIIKGVSTIMVSYSSWNGMKMHANHELVTGFLKNILKFKGFVISDWAGIDRITSPPHANYTYSVLAGVQAGIDMVMLPFNHTEFIDDLTGLVKSKAISMDRINDAVRRILLVKFTMGLFENPLADLSLVNELGSQAHRDLAREAVRKSLVLLKNGKNESNPILPLPRKAPKILVAGSHADNLGYQCGGWTINWQGFSGNNLTRGTTILSAIRSSVDPSTEVIYRETPDAKFVRSNKFDYAIVAVGEVPYAETTGDSMTLTMLESGPNVIKNVCEAVKCVVIIISGRPIVIEPYVSSIDALVAAWLPGTEGQGVTDVLYGDFGFSGKLPRTWFKTVDQLPMNVGDPHYDPLYPFDFGLKTESVPSLVASSTSAGVDKRPCIVLIVALLMICSYFTGIYSS